MTLRQYIALMFFGTMIAGIALFTIMSSVSPGEAGTLLFMLLYVALFCTSLGFATLIGLVARMTMFRDAHSIPQKVEMSFRQGILFGCLATASMILKGNNMLTWWNSIMLVGAISSIEMAFMGLNSRR